MSCYNESKQGKVRVFKDGKCAEEHALLKDSNFYMMVPLNLVGFSSTSEHVGCIFVERMFRKIYNRSESCESR